MEISYLGHSSFKIRGKTTTLVTDPYSSEMTGLKFPKVEADILTISHEHEDHNKKELVLGSPFVISGPGEYEVKNVSIFGISSFHDSKEGSERGQNTIYLIEIDGIRICHLGDLGHKLSDLALQELNGVDILFVPVGGIFTLGPRQGAEVISQLEPKIVIPMHYNFPGLNPSVFGKTQTLDDFLHEMGEKAQVLPKLTVTGDKLPEEMQIIVLERKNG
ncbi:MAG: MBL fold metallo-hydrolase [Patescibacteria group bacterium]